MTRSSATQTATRAIIAALVSAKATDTDERIRTLRAALAARGIVVVGELVQRRGVSRARYPGGSKKLEAPLSSATILGRGKVAELALLARDQDADSIFFLNHLSATQLQRISSLTKCAVFSCPDVPRPLPTDPR